MKAFPIVTARQFETGMDLRDYFAAKAMQAMANAICKIDDLGIISHAPNDVAQIAYVYADAMMKAREQCAK